MIWWIIYLGIMREIFVRVLNVESLGWHDRGFCDFSEFADIVFFREKFANILFNYMFAVVVSCFFGLRSSSPFWPLATLNLESVGNFLLISCSPPYIIYAVETSKIQGLFRENLAKVSTNEPAPEESRRP